MVVICFDFRHLFDINIYLSENLQNYS